MFKCKVCIEKDLRIEDLKRQIILLTKLLAPSQTPESFLVSLEANKVLGGDSEQVRLETDDLVSREADLVLSGNYDQNWN